MTEIPADIMKAAREAIEPWTIDDGTVYQFDECALSVARAILAERERCIEIANSGFDKLRTGSTGALQVGAPSSRRRDHVYEEQACSVNHLR